MVLGGCLWTKCWLRWCWAGRLRNTWFIVVNCVFFEAQSLRKAKNQKDSNLKMAWTHNELQFLHESNNPSKIHAVLGVEGLSCLKHKMSNQDEFSMLQYSWGSTFLKHFVLKVWPVPYNFLTISWNSYYKRERIWWCVADQRISLNWSYLHFLKIGPNCINDYCITKELVTGINDILFAARVLVCKLVILKMKVRIRANFLWIKCHEANEWKRKC